METPVTDPNATVITPVAEVDATKIMRLEVANMQLRLLSLAQQRTMIENQAQQLQASAKQLYLKLKAERQVPEGLEIDLDNGNIIDPKGAA